MIFTQDRLKETRKRKSKLKGQVTRATDTIRGDDQILENLQQQIDALGASPERAALQKDKRALQKVRDQKQERLDALEQIRSEYHQWKYQDAQPRFQRVYRVIKRP